MVSINFWVSNKVITFHQPCSHYLLMTLLVGHAIPKSPNINIGYFINAMIYLLLKINLRDIIKSFCLVRNKYISEKET